MVKRYKAIDKSRSCFFKAEEEKERQGMKGE
jgi:hypothetical protein